MLVYLYKNLILPLIKKSNLEEDIDLKEQFRIKNLPDPINIQDACSEKYVDNKLGDPSILKDTAHIGLND